jgi:energy-converting hydrogenase Eha subunit E
MNVDTPAEQTGTENEPVIGPRTLWPMVAMFGLGLAAIVVILIFVPSQNAAAAAAVPAILALLGTVMTGAYVAGRVTDVRDKVTEVDRKVNGHLTALTSKIPDANGGTPQ